MYTFNCNLDTRTVNLSVKTYGGTEVASGSTITTYTQGCSIRRETVWRFIALSPTSRSPLASMGTPYCSDFQVRI